ncbi:MAG TPA: ATPase domain-containing protein, partial [Herpetosiphonaceae bacterium]
GGGIPRGALVFLVGSPGAGKTILASQILFEAARAGSRGLIFTAFSEGPVKLLAHLRTLTFFDEELIGSQITVLSLPTVIGDDVTRAASAIVHEIRQNGAQMVLVDGFQGVAAFLESPTTIRRTLADLANLLSYLDVVLLVTLEGAGRSATISSELTTADTILGLEYRAEQGRHIRSLDVVKQRGTAHLAGLHPYQVGADGVRIFPRFESLPLPDSVAITRAPAPFGLPELDALLHGGLTRGTTTILAGAPGVGKTTLGLFWALATANPSASTLMVSFAEQPAQLQEKSTAFHLQLQAAQTAGAIQLLRLSPVEIVPDVVASAILAALLPTTTRLVVDDLAGLLHALGDRGASFLSALVAQCDARGITSLFLLEIEPLAGLRLSLANTALSLISDNVIILQHLLAQGRLHRVLAVLKMRYNDYDPTIREMVLDAQGVRVLTPSQTAPGVLDDAADSGGGFAPSDDVDGI